MGGAFSQDRRIAGILEGIPKGSYQANGYYTLKTNSSPDCESNFEKKSTKLRRQRWGLCAPERKEENRASAKKKHTAGRERDNTGMHFRDRSTNPRNRIRKKFVRGTRGGTLWVVRLSRDLLGGGERSQSDRNEPTRAGR